MEWNEFLKICNVNFYTSRKDGLWYLITDKGYMIWISSFYPSKENHHTIWFSDIEINKNSPKITFEFLDEFIQGAIDKFNKMKLEVKLLQLEKKNKAVEIAKELKRMDMDVEVIARLTKLSIEEINALRVRRHK